MSIGEFRESLSQAMLVGIMLAGRLGVSGTMCVFHICCLFSKGDGLWVWVSFAVLKCKNTALLVLILDCYYYCYYDDDDDYY